MSGRSLRVIAFLAAVGFGAQAWAADKNPCPPIKPKPDMMKIIKAMNSGSITQAEMMKIMSANSRVIKKPATWSGCYTVRDALKRDNVKSGVWEVKVKRPLC